MQGLQKNKAMELEKNMVSRKKRLIDEKVENHFVHQVDNLEQKIDHIAPVEAKIGVNKEKRFLHLIKKKDIFDLQSVKSGVSRSSVSPTLASSRAPLSLTSKKSNLRSLRNEAASVHRTENNNSECTMSFRTKRNETINLIGRIEVKLPSIAKRAASIQINNDILNKDDTISVKASDRKLKIV
jgi:hypothetical protein